MDVFIAPVERRNKHRVFPTDRFQFDEAVFGHGKTGHHLDKALYRNQERVYLQAFMAATSMNLEKLVSARSAN